MLEPTLLLLLLLLAVAALLWGADSRVIELGRDRRAWWPGRR